MLRIRYVVRRSTVLLDACPGGRTAMLIASRRSVMEYRVAFNRASLRGIPEGSIVSREEVEIQLGLCDWRGISMLEVPSVLRHSILY